MADRPRFILASESARRLALLRQVGLEPDKVLAAHIDETPLKNEVPRACAARLAAAKADAIGQTLKSESTGALILAADTVVACGRRLLPKAETEEQARTCLNLLSGRAHRVYSGVTLLGPDGTAHHRLVVTRVTFKVLSKVEIASYLNAGEWQGKAGGYAVQGRAAAFVRALSGSYTNVVGLPLFETVQMLRGCGYPVD